MVCHLMLFISNYLLNYVYDIKIYTKYYNLYKMYWYCTICIFKTRHNIETDVVCKISLLLNETAVTYGVSMYPNFHVKTPVTCHKCLLCAFGKILSIICFSISVISLGAIYLCWPNLTVEPKAFWYLWSLYLFLRVPVAGWELTF